jgi:integrase
LLEKLGSLFKTAKNKLVFPTKSGRPNFKLLRACKRIAERAGLDKSEFWLHRWRSDHATRCLRGGMDIETLRVQMGHSQDSKSIWRYLEALKDEKRGEKVAQVWAKTTQERVPSL